MEENMKILLAVIIVVVIAYFLFKNEHADGTIAQYVTVSTRGDIEERKFNANLYLDGNMLAKDMNLGLTIFDAKSTTQSPVFKIKKITNKKTNNIIVTIDNNLTMSLKILDALKIRIGEPLPPPLNPLRK